ncbi:MAG: IclR family transcriptional regulator [Chloroflexi bacterium]|nr:IclR family transcriptional regulator [Chloroflexota bacterium]
MTRDDRYNIRVLDRAVSILQTLSDGKPRTLVELSEAVELNNSTTFRLLSALASHNYVERDEATGKYSLGLACLELARSYQMNNQIRRAALPEMEALRDETGETIHLAILDRMEVVYLEKLHGFHAIGLMVSHVGGRVPAYCTGLGKLLLAYLDGDRVRAHYDKTGFVRFTNTTITDTDALLRELEAIQQRGYAFDWGEHEADVRCVAAPIFDPHGKTIAAISIAGPASRMEPLETDMERINRIVRAAGEISARLGFRQMQPN